ncbi:hypothetical protein DH2020_014466 [Rehmannia glutinosa]|uniref:Uncharacterized protein n=1 Tax=Rehmannia glutinosa TaxID=99300 RepID=A0ABR0WZ16_REHGL
MAVKTQFPLFAPPQLLPKTHRLPTEIRFSRWNNANAQKFIRHDRNQKELEDQIRIEKRFDSALTIAHNYNPAPPHPTTFKSTGTPSAPSSPSIPGKSSKYSKTPSRKTLHPAFKPLPRPRKIPVNENETEKSSGLNFRIDENGVSYEIPEAPFVYQYSYTETPKVKPVKLREPLVSPFGPGTMAKPWLGRKPLPPSKKKLPEFDSFQLPPPHKKGVKPVQAPGPFLPGSGPKYVRSREEVLGTPLTKEEIEELIKGSKKSNRQLNMDVILMESATEQEKTGGKIIYNRGGVIYLFRGRNYNYKSRPRFPLMLWKPVTPVYPRLIQRVPEGLTLEEANDMRKRGSYLTPICKLGLLQLQDLVPCVLLSFECEHILVWRGRDWQSLLEPDESLKGLQEVKDDDVASELLASPSPSDPSLCIMEDKPNDLEISLSPTYSNEESQGNSEYTEVEAEDIIAKVPDAPVIASHAVLNGDGIIDESEKSPVFPGSFYGDPSEAFNQTVGNDATLENTERAATVLNYTKNADEEMNLSSVPCTEGILLLREQAVENGMALVLDDHNLDADTVFKKSVDFAKTAPTGPVFSLQRKQLAVQKNKEQERDDNSGSKEKEAGAALGTEVTVPGRRNERKTSRNEKLKDIKADYLNVVPQGNLRIDELAKLLA